MSDQQQLVSELTRNIEKLTDALSASERRYRGMERLQRWMVLGFFAFFTLVAYIGTDLASKAHAVETQLQAGDPMQSFLAKLETHLDNFAAGFRAIGPALEDGGILLQRLRKDSDALRALIAKRQGIANPADMQGTGLDLEQSFENELKALQSIAQSLSSELHLVNQALSAMPGMLQQMHEMNLKMGVMSHGVGSTMGRMGNMMPW
ncbi:MAG: hypothetical protein KDH88_07040 [Chromatiales bacterium]|nr:hypothetical protein [Chromatiales bacterium]